MLLTNGPEEKVHLVIAHNTLTENVLSASFTRCLVIEVQKGLAVFVPVIHLLTGKQQTGNNADFVLTLHST